MTDSIIECYLQETARINFGNVDCNVRILSPTGRPYREVDLVINAHENGKPIKIAVNYHGWYWHFNEATVSTSKIQYDLDTIKFYKSPESPYDYIFTLAESKEESLWYTSDEFYYYVPIPNSEYRSWCISICNTMLDLLRFTDEIKSLQEYHYPNAKVITEKAGSKGYRSIVLPPEFTTWKSYLQHLLSLEPDDKRARYLKKFATSERFWSKTGGALSDTTIEELKTSIAKFTVGSVKSNYKSNKRAVTFQEYPDDIPEVTDFASVPSYKRMCVCVKIKDYNCNYMGF